MGRVLLVVAGTWLTVLVGLLTNLVTGDSPPWWLWVVWVVGAVALTLVELRRQRGSWSLLGGAPEPTPRDRVRVLARSSDFVASSLRETLGPVEVLVLSVRSDGVSDSLVAAYDRDESLLVLGAAGSGKSTELLRLAKVLARRAERGNRVPQPVPVVLSLAGWGRAKRNPLRRKADDEPPALLDWLLAQARARYGVLPDVARVWLRQRQLVLLLDGLDEVRGDLRARCVKAVNELAADPAAPPLVVTCRTADYEGLALGLSRTATIEPLTPEQVEQRIGVLDPELRKLVDTPLWLRVATTVTREVDLSVRDPESLRRNFLEGFLKELLDRRGGSVDPGLVLRRIGVLVRLAAGSSDPERVPVRLGNISLAVPGEAARALRRWVLPTAVWSAAATGMVLPLALRGGLLCGVLAVPVVVAAIAAGRSVTQVDFAERYAVDPVRTATRRIAGAVAGLVLGGVTGLGTAAVTMFVASLAERSVFPVIAGVTGALVIGAVCLVGLVGDDGWSGVRVGAVTAGGAVVGGLVGFLLGLAPADFVLGFSAGLLGSFGFMAVMDFVLSGAIPDAETGHRERRARWTGAVAPVATAAVLGVAWPAGAPWTGALVLPLAGLLVGAVVGFPFALFGSMFVDTLFVWLAQGLMLKWTGMLPWRTRRFLRHAADHGLITRSGKGFRFPHLVLRDHLRDVDVIDGRASAGLPVAGPGERLRDRVVRQLGVRAAEHPALVRPWERVHGLDPERAFRESGQGLLVCGPAPETSAVLRELAHALAEGSGPVPVLVDLAAWPGQRWDGVTRPFTGWLLNQLRDRYGIDPATGLRWLTDHRFVLLVDGQVGETERAWVFSMIEDFRRAYRQPPMVLAGGPTGVGGPEGLTVVQVDV